MQKLVIFISIIFAYNFSLSANTLENAKLSLDNKNYQQSLSILNTLVTDDPDDIEAIYYLALNHYLLGNYERTISLGVRAYTKNHELAKEVRQHSNKQNFGADIKIGLFRKIRLAKQIRNELYVVLQSAPNNTNAHFALGYYYILTPYLLSGSIKKSLYHIDQVAKIDKERAYPIYNAYYKKTKQSEKYLNNLKLWQKTYPNDWFATLESARYEQEYGDQNKAYALIFNWIQTQGDDAKAIYQIGRLAATSGNFLAEGENNLLKYLTLPHDIDNPEYKWAHYRLSMIYQHKGNINKAKDHIAKALALDPKNKEFLKFKKKL